MSDKIKKEDIKAGFEKIRQDLIQELEKLCPPCRFKISDDDRFINIENAPTDRGDLKDFVVDLLALGETPEQWLETEIKRQKEKLSDPQKEKAKSAREFLDAFSKNLFKISLSEALEKKICVQCQKPSTEFRDPESRKEYGISGLCQDCQDKIWIGEDGEPASELKTEDLIGKNIKKGKT